MGLCTPMQIYSIKHLPFPATIVIYNINNVCTVFLINLMFFEWTKKVLSLKTRTFIIDPKLLKGSVYSQCKIWMIMILIMYQTQQMKIKMTSGSKMSIIVLEVAFPVSSLMGVIQNKNKCLVPSNLLMDYRREFRVKKVLFLY